MSRLRPPGGAYVALYSMVAVRDYSCNRMGNSTLQWRGAGADRCRHAAVFR